MRLSWESLNDRGRQRVFPLQVVFKIVPLEGALLVNGETQKRSEEILAEVAIALTLSRLREPTSESPKCSDCGWCTVLVQPLVVVHTFNLPILKMAHDHLVLAQALMV